MRWSLKEKKWAAKEVFVYVWGLTLHIQTSSPLFYIYSRTRHTRHVYTSKYINVCLLREKQRDRERGLRYVCQCVNWVRCKHESKSWTVEVWAFLFIYLVDLFIFNIYFCFAHGFRRDGVFLNAERVENL